jgi:site-specific recombinase XerD
MTVARTAASLDRTTTSLPTGGHDNNAAWLCAFADYLQARSLDPKTISNYVQDMQKFQKKVAKDLAAVTREELQAVQTQWQSEGASDATLRRRMAAFRNFYNFLNAGGYITSRPTANVRTPKGWERVPRAPAANDLEKVIEAIGHDDPFHIRDRAILLLFRDTGLRASAVANLLLSDVDCAGRCLTIRKDKFGKQHQAPLSKRTAEAIQEYINNARPYFLRDRISPYLFLGYHRTGAMDASGPVTRQQLCRIAKSWSKKVLGVASSPHKWRAACFTECAEKEMDVFDLMNLAGHSSPEVTQGYIRHQLGHLKQAYRDTHPRALKTPIHDPK